jgi:lipid-binding SYLF domain-containing protein
MRSWFTAFFVASFSTLVWLSPWATPSAGSPTTIEDELLRDATLVFDRAVDTPAAAIPASILLRARGVAVFPTAAKDGALYYALGVLSARRATPEMWTPPAIVGFEGAIPLDLEATSVDFVLIAQTARGLDYLSQHRFDSPVTHRIWPGPLGQDTRAHVDADILAYMQFGDYFAGVTIDDWGITEMRDSNERLYGHAYSTDEILRGMGFFKLPPAARRWRDHLARYFRGTS